MQTTKIFLILPLVFAIIAITACESKDEGKIDDSSLEISPDSEAQVIEKDIDGIVFKFCLLNEQGKPATIFKKGENFVFSFSFKNNLTKNISVPTQFINDDFYRVYRNNNIDMGKAWTGIWCNFRYEKMIIELSPYEYKQLHCPWLWSENFWPDYPLCKADDGMNPLSQGKYSTTLHFDFIYTIDGEQKNIKDIIFQINFNIQ